MIATISASDRLVASVVCDLDFCVLDPVYSACPMQCFVQSNVELRVEGMPLLCLVVRVSATRRKFLGLSACLRPNKCQLCHSARVIRTHLYSGLISVGYDE